MLKKLPKEAREMWESTFKVAKEKYGSERAGQIAWAVVKKKYKKEGDKWIKIGRDLNMSGKVTLTSEKLVCRGESVGDLSNDYFLEGYIATPNFSMDNYLFTPELLESLSKQIKEHPINIKGDLDHVGTRMKRGMKVKDNLPTYENFMKIVDTNIDSNGLWVKAKLDKYTDNFPLLWNKIKEGFYDAFSIEVGLDKESTRLELVNGRYVNVARKGTIKKFSLTGEPVDKYSRITSAYTK